MVWGQDRGVLVWCFQQQNKKIKHWINKSGIICEKNAQDRFSKGTVNSMAPQFATKIKKVHEKPSKSRYLRLYCWFYLFLGLQNTGHIYDFLCTQKGRKYCHYCLGLHDENKIKKKLFWDTFLTTTLIAPVQRFSDKTRPYKCFEATWDLAF